MREILYLFYCLFLFAHSIHGGGTLSDPPSRQWNLKSELNFDWFDVSNNLDKTEDQICSAVRNEFSILNFNQQSTTLGSGCDCIFKF